MRRVADAWSLLQRRLRAEPGSPLVTYVDADSGERTELSAVSLANAAAKIANALRDEFELDPGATVGLHLPVHWQRAAWCAGAWTAGCAIAPASTDADLVVASPDEAVALAAAGVPDVAVASMHPFGMPITGELPPGCVDVTLTVRQQPDAYLFEPPAPDSPALVLDGDRLDQQALLERAAARAADWRLESGGRLLVDASTSMVDGWLGSLAAPLIASAAVVLVRGEAGASLREQERITAVAG